MDAVDRCSMRIPLVVSTCRSFPAALSKEVLLAVTRICPKVPRSEETDSKLMDGKNEFESVMKRSVKES